MCRVIADAVEEGRFIASRKKGASAPAVAAPAERTAEEEAAHAAAQADARRQAAEAAAAREARIAADAAEPSQSAVENETLAPGEPVPAEPGLTPENAENVLDDAEVAGDEAAAAADRRHRERPDRGGLNHG